MNWKKLFIYGFGIILVLIVLFSLSGIVISMFGFLELFLWIIKTPTRIIITVGLIVLVIWLARLFAGVKDD